MAISDAKGDQIRKYLQSQGFEHAGSPDAGEKCQLAFIIQETDPTKRRYGGKGEREGEQVVADLHVDDNWALDDQREYVTPFVNYDNGSLLQGLFTAEEYIWPEGTDDIQLKATASAKQIGDAIIKWSNDVVAWLDNDGVQKAWNAETDES